ncbi:MAG: phospholipase D-like domain-containing protein, partial [Alphaproteobacteria bacterium]
MSEPAAPPEPVAHFVTPSDERLTLYAAYRPWIEQLIADIDAAREEVAMEMYIFEPAGEGGEVAAALLRAVERGVPTRVMVDGLGCELVPSAFFIGLREAGVELRVYNPLEPWSKFYKPGLPLRRRNHRKLVVVDRRIGHLGGM